MELNYLPYFNVFLCLILFYNANANANELLVDNTRNYLWKETNAKNGIESINTNLGKWRDNLRKEIATLLQSLPQESKKKLIEKADTLNAEAWKSLKVSDYIMFVRDGNRNIFEGTYYERRTKLSELVIAELLSGKGKYMDQIANGLWLILEEST
jgi:hypothetical protein